MEHEAKRLFIAHAPLIRRCIERFGQHAKHDGNSRVALGFMPLDPDKYTRLSQLYQTVHHLSVALYHLHREGATTLALEHWVNLLQFDPAIIRSNQGWAPSQRPSEQDDPLRQGFERMSMDILAFRQLHLKEILTFARQAAELAAASGRAEAQDLFQSVSDQFFLRQRHAEEDTGHAPARGMGHLSEQIRLPLSFFHGLLRRAV